jgi:hypothetical protein
MLTCSYVLCPCIAITIGEDVDSVCEELRLRLLALGYKDGNRNDGVTFKYPAYLRMLFDNGVFSTRSSLFADGAREIAHTACRKTSLSSRPTTSSSPQSQICRKTLTQPSQTSWTWPTGRS